MLGLGGGPRCPVCSKAVYFNEKLHALGQYYHKTCFKCAQCKTSLQLGKQEEHDGRVFCATCYRKKYGPKGYGFGNTLTETGVRAGGRPLSTASIASVRRSVRRSKKKVERSEPIAENRVTAQQPVVAPVTAPTPAVPAQKERHSSRRSTRKSTKSTTSKSPTAESTSKSAKVELKQGKQWTVEGVTKEDGVVEVNVTGIAQTVYIYGATEATIVINGKCNSIAIDKCTKSKVLLDSVLATVEISNSKRMQIQVREFAPSLSVDSTDGCLVYLSAKCTENPDFSITAAKSSEMNISFPNPLDPEGDYVELPLPEQFKYTIDATGEEAVIETKESDLYSS